ncbi:MAG: cupin-like domain-containing protein [Blastomonas sp.]
MTSIHPASSFAATQPVGPVFSDSARAMFALGYPEAPHKLVHGLHDHPLLEREALARLAESMPASSIEYNLGDLPIGIDPDDVPANGMGIGDTIRQIDSANSWAVIKNIEQDPEYRALLLNLLEELRPVFEATTGAMLRPQGFIFISSQGSMTPYHFDPEHNILLQIKGSKAMTVFPAGDRRFAPATAHESYHSGGPRNLIWNESFMPHGETFTLDPGEAIFVPVMAPHYVRNGDAPSISLSITWRSDWSFAESDAHALNGLLRKYGLNPQAPGRFPARNRFKSLLWRALRKARIAG